MMFFIQLNLYIFVIYFLKKKFIRILVSIPDFPGFFFSPFLVPVSQQKVHRGNGTGF